MLLVSPRLISHKKVFLQTRNPCQMLFEMCQAADRGLWAYNSPHVLTVTVTAIHALMRQQEVE